MHEYCLSAKSHRQKVGSARFSNSFYFISYGMRLCNVLEVWASVILGSIAPGRYRPLSSFVECYNDNFKYCGAI